MTGPTVAVITAATARNIDEFKQCLESVENQTYPAMHYLFFDGIIGEHERFYEAAVYWDNGGLRNFAFWPGLIGGEGWEGRRVYAAAPFLVNEDIVMFLNEDDWYEPNHVQSHVDNIIGNTLAWSANLRNVYSKDGRFICRDDCESIAPHPIWNAPEGYLIETCSYAMRNEVAKIVAPIYGQPGYGPDRAHYQLLCQMFPRWSNTGLYTLNFRLGGNPNSVSQRFFEVGNAEMKKRYPKHFPWNKQD